MIVLVCKTHKNTKKLVYFFQYTEKWQKIQFLTHDFVSPAARRWVVLAIYFRTSQSERAKSAIHLRGLLINKYILSPVVVL